PTPALTSFWIVCALFGASREETRRSLTCTRGFRSARDAVGRGTNGRDRLLEPRPDLGHRALEAVLERPPPAAAGDDDRHSGHRDDRDADDQRPAPVALEQRRTVLLQHLETALDTLHHHLRLRLEIAWCYSHGNR